MIDFHGWVVLSDATDESDDEVTDERVRVVRDEAERLRLGSVTVAVGAVGGMWTLSIHGVANHRSEEHAAIEAFLARTAELLPGSWGTVYWRDDELPDTGNAYRVLVIARGTTRWHDDRLLSPCNPVIED